MVFTDTGRTQIRNWMAGTTATYPSYMLFGTDSSSTPTRDSTTMSTEIGKAFTDTITTIERQIRWEGILYTTDMTDSSLAQIGISTTTSGTDGTVFVIENINPIEHNDTFDIQVIQIVEVD